MKQTNICSASLAWGQLITLGRATITARKYKYVKKKPHAVRRRAKSRGGQHVPFNSRSQARRIAGPDL
jgi:hypothetical protein